MEERLRYILDNINGWLKFAEGKNAAILAANSALLFGAIRIIHTTDDIHKALLVYMSFAILFLGLAILVSLISFVPQIREVYHSSKKKRDGKSNLIFYADIAYYESEDYLEALSAQLGLKTKSPSPLEKAYAQQIITNARITLYKFDLSNIALWLTISAILTPIITFIILIITKRNGLPS